MPRNREPLKPRDIEVLEALAAYKLSEFNKSEGIEFCRPLDIGGTNGSYHSDVLRKLAERNLVKRAQRGGGSRGSYRYAIGALGEAELRKLGFYERWNAAQDHLRRVHGDV